MEKLEKKKHDHKATKILKILIFMFVMFAPFFSVLSKCLYTLNPNAKDSYYGKTINNVIKNEGYKDLNTYYELALKNFNTDETIVYNVKIVNVEGNTPETIQNNYTTINQLYFYKQNDSYILRATYNETTTYYWYYKSNTYDNTIIQFYLTSIPTNQNYKNFIYYYEYNKYSYLDNVFEYAVDQLNNNNLYNWSKNTGIYTAIDGMINGLGANEVLSMLLAYWGILTAIYIVFDIVIECFTKLTHMLTE